jgi:ribosome maturation factor RimP
MAVDLDQLRAAAQRVAVSHGLDVVDLDFAGGGKFRALRVFVEKNAAGRAKLAEAAEAARASAAEPADEEDAEFVEGAVPQAVLEGTLSIEHLSGVTHEDCEQFSRDFGMLLDVEDLIPGSTEYTLEVSSPGLDRKLSRAEDYERFTHSLVKLQTFTPVAGNRHWKGRITQFVNGKLTLDLSVVKQKKAKPGKAVKEAAAETVEIELANVEKANLVPEF